ncbi:hypothetical protein [Enterobacter cloacae complex sp. 288G10]|uniref:hypothetical protein n=1 Tax=Enterobacter cloacae complex sp. 288G10 TaxID=3395859 RepID=UPI003CEB6A2F
MAGMPVTLLAFPEEQDLLTKIAEGAPKRPYAEIVRVRHNLCHGNILEHIIQLLRVTIWGASPVIHT